MFKIGFMQGRLVKSEKPNFIQSFPWKNWKKEFHLANENKIKILEWTLDYRKFNQNPLIDIKKLSILQKIKNKHNIKINSVTCDFYMQKPYINFQSYKISMAKKLYSSCICLPSSYNLSVKEINFICEEIIIFSKKTNCI